MTASGWARSSRSGSSARRASTTSKGTRSGSWSSGQATRTRTKVPEARSTPVVSSAWQASTSTVSGDPAGHLDPAPGPDGRAARSRAVPLRGVRVERLCSPGRRSARRASSAAPTGWPGRPPAAGRRSSGTRRPDPRSRPSHSGDAVGSPQASTAPGQPPVADRVHQVGPVTGDHHLGEPLGQAGRRSARCGRRRSGAGRGARRTCRPPGGPPSV